MKDCFINSNGRRHREKKIFDKHIPDKGLLSQIYKDSQNSKRVLKCAKDLDWYTSPEKIHGGKISTDKDFQHHRASGKCNLKPQSDATVCLLESLPFFKRGKKKTHPNITVMARVWSNQTLIFAGWNANCCDHFVKIVWQFLMALNILLLHNPAILLSGINAEEMKIYGYTKTLRWESVVASFTITKDRKWHKYHSTSERIRNPRNIHETGPLPQNRSHLLIPGTRWNSKALC